MKELKYLDYTKGNEGHILIPSCKSVYPDMGVGTAQQIQTNIHESDSTPYVFRPTPFNSTRESGELVGASVAWNQLATHLNQTITTNGCSFTYNNGKITVKNTPSAGAYFGFNAKIIKDHKYLLLPSVEKAGIRMSDQSNPSAFGNGYFPIGGNAFGILNAANNNSNASIGIYITTGFDGTETDFYYTITDLTALFCSSTIADYIYNLESGTAGAGIAKLREWGFFDKPYYAYNAGGIESVNVSSHKMVGLNIFDEAWVSGSFDANGNLQPNASWSASEHFMPVIGGTYYALIVNGISSSNNAYLFYYDANKAFIGNSGSRVADAILQIPSNCAYMKIQYKRAIADVANFPVCINISKQGVNGTYEPYTVNEYPLDYSLTLRGIYKLDGSNNLYADGDVYHSDGTVDRNWAERAYQAGDESLADAITDGTTTVYKLITPTTETADPFQSPQVCSPYGTEEFVDAGVAAGTRDVAIPCGHSTEYMKNIVGAIEGIPLPPSANGTYTLKVTVASGVPTYSWVSG